MRQNDTVLQDYRRDMSINRGPMDIPFLLIVLLLLGIGVIMVLSASYASAYYDLNNETGSNATYYFTRQLAFAIGGVVLMYIFSRLPMDFYRRFSKLLMFGSIALLAAVLVIGTESHGAKRWINLGFTNFQPSEIAKIAVILYFSHRICQTGNQMGTFKKGVMPFAVYLVILVALLALEPHYSAALIIIAIGAIMLFAGGARMFWFVGGGITVVGFFIVAINFVDYLKVRIEAWQNPFADASDGGYQVIQSLYAIGSGGLFGLGLGQSRQKYLYLPEEHNDYIFSIICEELGFIGAGLILVLFALLIVRGYWLAMHMRDRYSFLVCTGITSLLAIQVLLNVCVCTNLLPCTGISLPFFSYGGTALLIQMGEMGIILSASRDIPVQKTTKRKRSGAQDPA